MSDRNNPSLKDIMKSLFGSPPSEGGDSPITPTPSAPAGEVQTYDKKAIYEAEIQPLIDKALQVAKVHNVTMLNIVQIRTDEVGHEVAMTVAFPPKDKQTPGNICSEILMMHGIGSQGYRNYVGYLIDGIANDMFPLTEDEFVALGLWACKHVAPSMVKHIIEGHAKLKPEDIEALKEWAKNQ